MAGALVAFEGIDQAGKMTQARAVQVRMHELGLGCEIRHYPDYETPIGKLIQGALCEGSRLEARARTMLFAANRWEQDTEVRALVQQNALVLVDRYSWSNVVYGISQGYDEAWLRNLESGLLDADLTVLVDITPEESRRRKSSGRDDFESDIELLVQARRHYLRLASEFGWTVIDGEMSSDSVTRRVLESIEKNLADRVPSLARVAK